MVDMKKTFFALAFAASVIFITVFFRHSSDASAIVDVLHQQTEAVRKFNDTVPHLNGRQMAQQIADIDVSKCPKDFRQAWDNYVDTLWADTKWMGRGNSASVHSAFDDVRSCAVKHGVIFK
jgi:hypothetical protein